MLPITKRNKKNKMGGNYYLMGKLLTVGEVHTKKLFLKKIGK
jgi:hypothetical protein